MLKIFYQHEYEKYKTKAKQEGRFYLLGSKFFGEKITAAGNLKYIYSLCKSWDNVGEISLELGEMLEELLTNKETILGIHKTNLTDEELESIFNEGLINNGDAISSGAYNNKYNNPSKTITPITNIINAIIMLNSQYKNAEQSIICILPKNLVDEELHLKDQSNGQILYEIKDNIQYLKPEYLIGCVKKVDEKYTYFSKKEMQTKDELNLN